MIVSTKLVNEIIEEKLNGKTYAMIAQRRYVSRQYIQQILMPNKETIAQLNERASGKCEKCGRKIKHGHIHHNGKTVETYNNIENIKLLCVSCHRKEHGSSCNYICNNCGKEFTSSQSSTKSKVFCSKDCRIAYYHIPIACETCGKIIMERQSAIIYAKQKRFYCSRRCNGVAIYRLYGFRVNNKRKTRIGIYKWDYDKVWQVYQETKCSNIELAQLFGIPPTTICRFLKNKKLDKAIGVDVN